MTFKNKCTIDWQSCQWFLVSQSKSMGQFGSGRQYGDSEEFANIIKHLILLDMPSKIPR